MNVGGMGFIPERLLMMMMMMITNSSSTSTTSGLHLVRQSQFSRHHLCGIGAMHYYCIMYIRCVVRWACHCDCLHYSIQYLNTKHI